MTEDIKEGCTIIKSQAELLKVKFGSALANENQENEIVSIPGLRGRSPKEISVKNLANIIQARLEEIVENDLEPSAPETTKVKLRKMTKTQKPSTRRRT